MSDRQIQIVLDSLWPLLRAGVLYTIPLTLISFVLGLILAIIAAVIRLYAWKPLQAVAQFYVWIIRGTPLLVQLFIVFYGLPSIGVTLDPLPSAIIGFSLSVGAYGSEIVRASIQSIPKGQWEAAYSIGMTRLQALRRIILPQAARVSVPPLGNSFISLVKDTSLAASILYLEMFRKGQEIVARTYEPLLIYCEVAVIYLAFSTVLSALQHMAERRLGRSSAA
ncbi:amino acid ABC transporter permease [Cohnella lubricantis]|uniref:Amino acid ABC transporter permease n=1 Tax=Cohnella lubricantis TaxID=2163172 RepID=A0A841T9P5_9BACL|nr:amino acid ABC transporter permease [Cohnella lubricantis]MBB6678024.1 amino acid ABC transporter permease [Cohnella lubricantis]MBP2118141.1 cystine transport system permease protein [Cohnella lubricantis]